MCYRKKWFMIFDCATCTYLMFNFHENVNTDAINYETLVKLYIRLFNSIHIFVNLLHYINIDILLLRCLIWYIYGIGLESTSRHAVFHCYLVKCACAINTLILIALRSPRGVRIRNIFSLTHISYSLVHTRSFAFSQTVFLNFYQSVPPRYITRYTRKSHFIR